MTFFKLFKFDYVFCAQDGLSDVPSAPPIHDYDQDGLSGKKDEHREVNEGANLADKNVRYTG